MVKAVSRKMCNEEMNQHIHHGHPTNNLQRPVSIIQENAKKSALEKLFLQSTIQTFWLFVFVSVCPYTNSYNYIVIASVSSAEHDYRDYLLNS